MRREENQKAEPKGPRETKNPENTESYTLKLTCTGSSETASSPEQKRERTPCPQTQEAQRGRGEQLDNCPAVFRGKILPNPRTIEKNLHSKSKKGAPGQNKGEGGCANHVARAPRTQGSRRGCLQ